MHGPQDVLETSVFGRWKDPPGRLQLMDLTQALDPRRVDQLPLAHLSGPIGARNEREIPVHGIGKQVFVLKRVHGGRTNEGVGDYPTTLAAAFPFGQEGLRPPSLPRLPACRSLPCSASPTKPFPI